MKKKMKTIHLVGAPGSGKSLIKNFLKTEKDDYVLVKTLSLVRFFGHPSMGDIAVGSLSDYRTDLKIALDRVLFGNTTNMTALLEERHIVWTHSLLDSLAHITARLYRMINSGSVSELELIRWENTLAIINLVFMDTFQAEPFLFLRGNDGEVFSQDVEEALAIILNDWGIPYLELTSPKDAATMIRKVITEDFDIGKAIDAGKVTTNSSVKDNQ